MISEIITMNGYGLYVWLSFGITFLICTIIFFYTKKTLKKYERELATEINKLPSETRIKVLEKSKLINQILVSQKKII